MAKHKNDDAQDIQSLENIKKIFKDKWGDGSLLSLADDHRVQCEVIPSQSISLDYAMGVGGYPRGRIIEIFGPEASGKTTLALHAIAGAEKLNGKAAFIDAEHALSIPLMVNMGINPKNTLISQPDSGEQALEMCETLVASNSIDIIVVDSVAALVPMSELEGEIGQNTVASQARMMSQFLRRITAKVQKSKSTVIFINQIRHKIGVMFGSPEVTPGGNALKFYASIRLDIRKINTIKSISKDGKDDSSEHIGHEAKIKVVKNKVATPFKSCTIPLIYGKGIYYNMDVIEMATKCGVITKNGSWLCYKDTKLGMGKQNAAKYLDNNNDLANTIDIETRNLLFSSCGKHIDDESDMPMNDDE